MIDSKILKFGTSQDVTMQWDSQNFIIAALADDELIEIGDSAETQLSFDVKIYGNAASGAEYATFDAGASTLILTGYDINLQDGDLLNFGDGAGAAGDVSVWFDDDSGGLQIYPTDSAEAFTIGAASHVMNTTLTGTLTVGVDNTGYDVKFYGATASSFMHWDESADTLIVTAAEDHYVVDITGDHAAATQAVARITATATDGAVTCLELDQDDADKGFITFTGTTASGGSINSDDKSGGTAVYAMVLVGTSTYYIKLTPGA